ncbi:MAG TPA: hypothetical protein VLN58_15210 [Verrucomicrobiae bacterium]|nr:hypothetical protein [Verrucomicrobiae bacterium]
MLKISPAVTVTGVPGSFKGTVNSYILFPDSEDKDMYYALAEQPTYLADSRGNPSFNLTWYFGSGIESAGICTMTVALPMPDTNNPEVLSKITAALTTDQSTRKTAQQTFDLCQAMAANDQEKVKALKASLGFDDATAAKRKSQFDPKLTWEQFLPAGKINVRPIPFKSGSVTIQAFADANAYQQQQKPAFSTGSIQTTPSLFNSNAAVVTFNLKDLGANLFWHGLGGWQLDPNTKQPDGYDAAAGGSSVLTVAYQITFDGLLPEAKATVTLDQTIVAKLDMETVTKNGSWGRTYREEVVRGKEYNDAVNSATSIVLPAVASDSDKENVQKLLTDWAAKQLEDMAKSQLPGVNLGDLNPDNLRHVSEIKKQSRTYSLTQAVTLPKYPQAQLSKISGLAKGDDLKQLFQLINLNDVPYVNVNVTVRPPSADYLKSRNIASFVISDIRYAGQKLLDENKKEVTLLEFATNGSPVLSRTLSGTFGRNTPDRSLEYSYIVSYNDGTPAYHGATQKQSDDNYLDLAGVSLGVLSVNLNAIDLPWDVISSAKVDLSYGSWSTTKTLTNSGSTTVTQVFGKDLTGPLTYKITLVPTTGAPIVGDSVQVTLNNGNADITLKNPLGNMTNPISFNLDNGVVKAMLRANYKFNSNGPDRVFTRVISLDSTASPSVTWTVPAQSDKSSSLEVTKATVWTSGTDKTDLKDLTGGKVDAVPQQLAITVSDSGLSNF